MRAVFAVVCLLLSHLAYANVLVVSILEDPFSPLSKSAEAAVVFLTQLKAGGNVCGSNMICSIYISKIKQGSLKASVLADLERLSGEKISYFVHPPYPDNRVGLHTAVYEHVSEIGGAVKDALHRHHTAKGSLLSLAFSATSYPLYSNRFSDIFNFVSGHKNGKQVGLLGKTKELTSLSDWHDIMVLLLSLDQPVLSEVTAWLDSFLGIYKRHAMRQLFSVFEPRPALLESNLRHQHSISVGHFPPSALCVEMWEKDAPLKYTHFARHGGHSSFCGGNDTYNANLRVHCGDGSNYTDHTCATVHVPQGWRKDVRPLIGNIDMRFGNLADRKKDFSELEEASRYRYAVKPDQPLDFCWNSGCVIIFTLFTHSSI
jgi:hypothetical protein